MTTSEHSAGTHSSPALSVRAIGVDVTDDTLSVRLEDGRSVSVPLVWFPRLLDASENQRRGWELIGRGVGIHWEDIDEDISVENLLATRGDDLLTYRDTPSSEVADAVVVDPKTLGSIPPPQIRPESVTPELRELLERFLVAQQAIEKQERAANDTSTTSPTNGVGLSHSESSEET